MSVQLRPYQLAAIEACRQHIAAGKRAPLVVSPTGSGKSTMGSAIAAGHIAQGGRVLWLAHRRELLDQAAETLERFGLTVGIISPTAGRRVNPFSRCQVASIQTLRAREQAPEATLVVFDEARHHVASDWGVLARSYGGAIRIGLDATPQRADGVGLGDLFDSIVVAATIRELTEAGHLVACEVVGPPSPLRAGQIARSPVDAYREHAQGRQTVVFAAHLKAAAHHACEFREAGIACAVISGDMQPFARAKALADFEAGRLTVVITVGVLVEGWDSPRTSCAILARGCGSASAFLQMVGRILRPAPGKRDALLLDLRGVTHVHGRPDEDREYSLDGTGIRRKDDDAGVGRLCSVCGSPVGDDGRCQDCGRAPSELELPTVVGVKLEKYAALQQDSEDVRIERLAKWLADVAGRVKADGTPWKETAAMAKFQALYKVWPPSHIIHAARARARRAA